MNPVITKLEVEADYTSTYFSLDYLASRSKGVHLMDIVTDLEARVGAGAGRRKKNADFADSLDQFAILGFVWEHEITNALEALQTVNTDDGNGASNVVSMWEWILSRRFTEIDVSRRTELYKPAEQECDGIFLTPDGANRRLRRGEEFKCTWGTSALTPDQFAIKHWRWLVQGACYCRSLCFNEMVYRVYHVNGGYEKGRMGAPKMTGWRVEFSDEELEAIWQMVLNHKRTMVREGKLPKPQAPGTGVVRNSP